MLEFAVVFSLGFVISYCIVIYNYHKSELSYSLAIIKEDIVTLHIKISKLLDGNHK